MVLVQSQPAFDDSFEVAVCVAIVENHWKPACLCQIKLSLKVLHLPSGVLSLHALLVKKYKY
jgi:hypothetical protein